MKRRRAIITLGLPVIGSLAGCIGNDENNDDDTTDPDPESDDGEGTGSESDNGEGTGSESDDGGFDENLIFERGETHSFSGSGDGVTEEFSLDRGLIIVEYEFNGDINQVEIVPEDADGFGAGSDRIVANWSSQQGSTGKLVTGGTYRIDVNVEDEWSLDISQPEIRESGVASLPFEKTGTGTELIGPYDADASIVSANYRGSGLFTLLTFPIGGGFDVPFRKDGRFSGETTIEGDDISWAVIECDGDWQVEIQ